MDLDFSCIKVEVFGDIILDTYIHGEAMRLSPEAPVPIIKKLSKMNVLGGAANVAANISSLGGNAILHGIIGNDDNGLEIVRLCKEQNIKFVIDKDLNKPTINKCRILAGQHQICRIDKETPFNFDVCADVKPDINTKAVIFSDYNKGTINGSAASIIKHCSNVGIPTFVDFKDFNCGKYEGATVVKLNEREVLALAKEFSSVNNLCNAIIFVQKMMNCGIIIVTRANLPVLAYTNVDEWINDVTVPNVPVCDVSGAGDTFLAAFALAYTKNYMVRESIEFAVKCSTAKIQKLGTCAIRKDEV